MDDVLFPKALGWLLGMESMLQLDDYRMCIK